MALTKADLLPEYLKKDQRWVDLAEAIQAVFEARVYREMRSLKYIRHQYVPNVSGNSKIENREMLSTLDYEIADKELSIKQSNLLGLRLSDPTGIVSESLPNLVRNIGTFWFSKGLPDFVDFIAYTFNTPVTVTNLWTTDYIKFVEEGTQGTPIWEGGPWYPTTHVAINYDENIAQPLPIQAMVNVWLDISNYNLVLNGIGGDTYISIGHEDDPEAIYPSVATLDFSLVFAEEEEIEVPFY